MTTSPGRGRLIMLTGGARSGKSRYAQELAADPGGPVLYVATAEALDDEMKERIAEHRASRPASWRTLEASTNIGNAIAKELGDTRVVIVDCITVLAGNLLGRQAGIDEEWRVDARLFATDIRNEVTQLIRCIEGSEATFIVVTNEVGTGIVPDNQPSRVYRDVLGEANQQLASKADEVYLLVAGIPFRVK